MYDQSNLWTDDAMREMCSKEKLIIFLISCNRIKCLDLSVISINWTRIWNKVHFILLEFIRSRIWRMVLRFKSFQFMKNALICNICLRIFKTLNILTKVKNVSFTRTLNFLVRITSTSSVNLKHIHTHFH